MPVSSKTFKILKESRCADISDALDSMGLQDMYDMDPKMRPMILQTSFCGLARTIEFQKTDEKLPYMEYEEFEKLQYANKSDGGYSFTSNLKQPDLAAKTGAFFSSLTTDEVMIVACHGLIGGVCGSENSLGWVNQGISGIVFDGYMRDTDESIIEKIPVFSIGISYVHPQGRIQVSSVDSAVICGGVTVSSGDVIRADHDGVLVIPARHADEAAYRAYKIQQIDRVSRRDKYEKAGIPFDDTVELLPDIERWF